MSRSAILALMKVAGYHDDSLGFTRLYVENRISRKSADEQWASGKQMKKNGVPCGCYTCKQKDKS